MVEFEYVVAVNEKFIYVLKNKTKRKTVSFPNIIIIMLYLYIHLCSVEGEQRKKDQRNKNCITLTFKR